RNSWTRWGGTHGICCDEARGAGWGTQTGDQAVPLTSAEVRGARAGTASVISGCQARKAPSGADRSATATGGDHRLPSLVTRTSTRTRSGVMFWNEMSVRSARRPLAEAMPSYTAGPVWRLESKRVDMGTPPEWVGDVSWPHAKA